MLLPAENLTQELSQMLLSPQLAGSTVELDANAAHHATRVLRLAVGDGMTLFDGTGGEYEATLIRADKRGAAVRVERFVAVERESRLVVTLAQAIAATELGKLVFVPALNFNGVTSFTYTAGDGVAGSAATPATVTLRIRSIFDQAIDLKAQVARLWPPAVAPYLAAPSTTFQRSEPSEP